MAKVTQFTILTLEVFTSLSFPPRVAPTNQPGAPLIKKDHYFGKILKYKIIRKCCKASMTGGEEPCVAFVEKGRPSSQSVILP